MSEIQELRNSTYNATIIDIQMINETLAVYKIKPDVKEGDFSPGQFVNIGLFNFEPPILTQYSETKLIKRPYSVSSPLLNPEDELVDHRYADFYELYITLVPDGEFTPKLFQCKVDDRLHISEKALGHYIMPEIQSKDTIIFASTGTGLAPHNAMLVDMLNQVHEGIIVVFDCVRYIVDLGYKDLLESLAKRYNNLIYIPLATRESEEKVYIQDFFKNDVLESQFGVEIHPENTHVFCCGNPAMIGIPKKNRDTGEYEFQTPNGLVEILMTKYNLNVFRPKIGGQIHFEKYW